LLHEHSCDKTACDCLQNNIGTLFLLRADYTAASTTRITRAQTQL